MAGSGMEIAAILVDRFGDGISSRWRVPEYGQQVEITEAKTTIYASDCGVRVPRR